MTTTINLSVNMPQHYGVERLKRQLMEYANRLIAEESVLHDGVVRLTPEMIEAAEKAEAQYKDGLCVGADEFNRRFEKWL